MIFDNTNINDIDLLNEYVQNTGFALLIDKPIHWTSFDVVAKIRNLLKIKKIGHAGTLDPLADGLLILCVGKFTKKINEFQDLYKEYQGQIKIGATTKSYDSEFEEENICDISSILNDNVQSLIDNFIGEQLQVPPMFSAKKVNGKRLYELARKNQNIVLEPSLVNFYDIKLSYSAPYIDFYIKCSKGTYIRSFARDIGDKLNVGGYLTSLRRIGIGDYKVTNAIKLIELIKFLKSKIEIK